MWVFDILIFNCKALDICPTFPTLLCQPCSILCDAYNLYKKQKLNLEKQIYCSVIMIVDLSISIIIVVLLVLGGPVFHGVVAVMQKRFPSPRTMP